MGHALVLCAIGASGDAFWEQSTRLFQREQFAKTQADLLTRLGSEQLFPAGSAEALPSRQDVVKLLRERMPAGRIDSLQIGIALSAVEPHVAPRLDALLAAFEGICQIAAQLHLFVLGPDAYVRFSSELAGLEGLLFASKRRNLDCRDICWVRMGGRTSTIDPSPLADSRVRAATHSLWSEADEARRPFAILQGLDRPFRDSLSCHLDFDRGRWERYASAHLGARMLAAIAAEPQPETERRALEWLQQTALPALEMDEPAPDGLVARFTPPESLLDADPQAALKEVVAALQQQVTRVREVEHDTVGRRLQRLASGPLTRAIDGVAQSAPDEIQGLARAAHWTAALHAGLQREGDNTPLRILRRSWLGVCNETLGPVFGLKPSRDGFDLASPPSWPDRLAQLRMKLAPFLAESGETRNALRYCAAVWIDSLLPGMLDHPESCGDATAKIMAPLEEVVAAKADRVLEQQRKHQAARVRTESQFPPPSRGFWSGTKYRLFTEGHRRRALTACDRTHTADIRSCYDEIGALIRAASSWLALGIRHENLHRLAQDASAAFAPVLRPVEELFGAFRTKVEAASHDLDSFTDAPAGSNDAILLPRREQMAILAAEIAPRMKDWLAEAHQRLPEPNRPWLDSAREALASFDAWTLAGARSVQMDLPKLFERFPALVAEEAKALADLAHAALLPVRHERAGHRRLHQEWHLPDRPVLQRHPAFGQNIVADEVVSTAPASCVRFVSPDVDRLELHLHLLGFEPADYVHWNLFVSDAAARVDHMPQGQSE